MRIQNKTVLITGAGSGIGYAIAKLLKGYNNKIVIVGRNADKIRKAGEALGVDYLICDVSKQDELLKLVSVVSNRYPDLDILVNNAGVAHLYHLGENADAYDKAQKEFQVNYFAPLLLTEKLLPVLKKRSEAAIINITSNVSFHPLVILPTYSDTKTALHSHSVTLRYELQKDTNVKVFEVMPSLVNTDATKDMGGENGISPDEVAAIVYKEILDNQNEIYVGDTAKQRETYFKNPVEAILSFNNGL
ncbi:MAG: SDR family NAD(P)-dependent oxidoreductase [Prevotella sp.]|jgi:uncharacterized oxidoreductase|nr:SDR family NAD(P)-dependent oxidoreductase [Prevotella sp.]